MRHTPRTRHQRPPRPAGLRPSATAPWALAALALLAGAGCGAGRAPAGPAPERHRAYYYAAPESRPGSPPRRADAVAAMERACPRGYRVLMERPPRRDDPQGRGVIEFACLREPDSPGP